MPAKSGGKSKLAQMLAKANFDEVKGEETTSPGGGECPAGIENGISQLVEAKFGEYQTGDQKGELFFYAAAVIVSPEFIVDENGTKIPVKGLRTSIMEPLCDTPTRKRATAQEHLSWIMNMVRLLGLPTDELGEDDLEAALETLKEQAPYNRFRTWKSEPSKEWPNPNTQHTWFGNKGLEDYSPDGGDDVQDSGDDADEKEEKKPTTNSKAKDNKSKPKTKEKEEEPADEDDDKKGPEYPGDKEITAIGKKADKGDEDAQNLLHGHAEVFGIDKDDVDNADNWAAVAQMIIEKSKEDAEGDDNSSGDDTEASSDDDDTPWKPSKDDVVHYKVKTKDPKTKKMVTAKKPVECTVTKVDSKNETVDLKNLDDGTIYKAVGFDEVTST